MGVTAFPHPASNPSQPYGEMAIAKPRAAGPEWAGIAICGAFLAGGLLLASGRKRAGLVVTTAATAVTLLDQQETVREWWNAVPRYLDNVDKVLTQAQRALDDLAAMGERLRSVIQR